MMNLGWVLDESTMISLALLLILPTAHAQLDPLNLNSSGLEFLVAFPENIAHYHPITSLKAIEIFSLEGETLVEYKSDGIPMENDEMSRANTITVYMSGVELRRNPTSNKTIQIKSNKPIIVRIINSKDQSIQTSLVKATDKLGKVYKIPPTPSTITEILADPTSEIPERSPFTVIVMNTGAANDVQWKGDGDQTVSLAPFELAQFWMSNVAAEYEVDATEPVSVLFGHPCFTIFNCTCGMMVTPLDPESATELNYFIPPDFMTGSEKQAVLLIAGNPSPLPYDPDHPTVQSFGSVLFHIPGLLLSILPEEEFAACFQIHGNPDLGSIPRFAILVVHEDHKKLVHHGLNPLVNQVWNPILTTDYVSTRVTLLNLYKNLFWHPKSMIAVYELGSNDTTLFGNPAPIISKSTSLKGCVLDPELVNIGVKEMGWVESIKFCRGLGLELAAMDGVELRFLAPKLHAMNKTLEQVWIGYRRSSLTGDWYRLNKEEVLVTHWGKGEPGGEEEGQCAMMSLDPNKDFGWSDESYCTSAVPLCYKPPNLLR
ncbi:uncharacterized protein LOC115545761 [Gadus morhua]|uniref:uncharacterized protein LOC115545761 n=1 Tax=Gadus morhua TaxID=8049 RepID=UPI0011B3BCED|nr:uncharacterized protein LOC115545761 [Gadus morhua]